MKEIVKEIFMNEGTKGVEDYLDYIPEHDEIMEEESEL